MSEPPADDPDDLVQMNVRVPRWLRDAADTRRAQLNDPTTGRAMSRDRWISNAMKYALSGRERPTVNAKSRTAPRT